MIHKNLLFSQNLASKTARDLSNIVRINCFFFFLPIYSGTREVAAVLVPPVGFHHLNSAACVLGDFASCAEHFQSHNNRGSEPQTSSRGEAK